MGDILGAATGARPCPFAPRVVEGVVRTGPEAAAATGLVPTARATSSWTTVAFGGVRGGEEADRAVVAVAAADPPDITCGGLTVDRSLEKEPVGSFELPAAGVAAWELDDEAAADPAAAANLTGGSGLRVRAGAATAEGSDAEAARSGEAEATVAVALSGAAGVDASLAGAAAAAPWVAPSACVLVASATTSATASMHRIIPRACHGGADIGGALQSVGKEGGR